MFEQLKQTQLERKRREVLIKQANLDNWYKKNPWAVEYDGGYGSPEIGDDDYIAVTAIFNELFDVPNRF